MGTRTLSHAFFRHRRELQASDGLPALEGQAAAVIEVAHAQGVAPIFFGGDHSITYALVAALMQSCSALCLVVFDAHSDVQGHENSVRNWNVLRHVMERFGDRVRLVHVGFRDVDEAALAEKASLTITANELWLRGTADVVQTLRTACAGRPIYLSIDLDVLDPSVFPAVSAPISGGLTAQQLFGLVRQIGPFAAADVVEYDHDRRSGSEMLLLADLLHLLGGLGATDTHFSRR